MLSSIIGEFELQLKQSFSVVCVQRSSISRTELVVVCYSMSVSFHLSSCEDRGPAEAATPVCGMSVWYNWSNRDWPRAWSSGDIPWTWHH